MREQIDFGPSYATLTISLDPNESVKAEPGAMIAQSGVNMTTGLGNGIMGGFRRMMGGESFFVNTFTGDKPGGWVSLAPPTPGDIMKFDLSPHDGNLFIQSKSFLASTNNIELDSKFQGMRSLFSGEGAFFLRAYAKERPGAVYCNAYGAIQEISVQPDQELVVDNGHLVAFSEHVDYSIGKVGGLKSLAAGGEGLVIKLHGNGTVWIQTRNLSSLAEILNTFLPKRKD